ncbi:MAG TPA: glutathione S-transferase family protein [Candidatus Acidoferrales bacterium]|nr:glutathione S-transferase family protein [Candidatus Acidoferrales bacterium]
MANIKLYDFTSSPNCQRVKVVLSEKGLPYDIVPVDLRKKEQKNPEFLRLNPYGKVPVLVDGDTVLYESCIINEYLEEKYPEPPLMPKDPALRARIRILIDYGMNHLNAPYQILREELAKEEKDRDQAKIEEAKREARGQLKRFEEEIGDNPFLAGGFSLLDADLIPRFLRYETMGVLPDPSLPRLSRWLQRMKERPSVRQIS